MKQIEWLWFGVAMVFVLSGCKSAPDVKAKLATGGKTTSSSTKGSGGSGETGKSACGGQLRALRNMTPTEILKSEKFETLTEECQKWVEDFSAAYEEVLEVCEAELEDVGDAKVIPYLGKLRSEGKLSEECEAEAENLRPFLPPPPGRAKASR